MDRSGDTCRNVSSQTNTRYLILYNLLKGKIAMDHSLFLQSRQTLRVNHALLEYFLSLALAAERFIVLVDYERGLLDASQLLDPLTRR